MTIIEFYDKNHIENIASSMLCRPERVIFVGDNGKAMKRSYAVYDSFLQLRGINVQFGYCSVNKNKLGDIVDTLTHLVEKYEDCIFDLTGGDDLFLVAVGIVMEKYPALTRAHRFNFFNNSLIDCDCDGVVCQTKSFEMTVEGNISIYGGNFVTYAPDRSFYTYNWYFSGDFINDIQSIWEICRKNESLWNAQITTLNRLVSMYSAQDSLSLSFERSEAQELIKSEGLCFTLVEWIMYSLANSGLIYNLRLDEVVSFTFKNEQVKRCLTVAGQALELFVASRLRALKDDDGSAIYNDVRVGVVIDWCGDDEEDDGVQTLNEIDVMAMHGLIPIFISCKNGKFTIDELYKLDAVACEFGGDYAKKVLIATGLDRLGARGEHIRARAEDMGIRIIDGLDSLPIDEIDRILKSLWCNS